MRALPLALVPALLSPVPAAQTSGLAELRGLLPSEAAEAEELYPADLDGDGDLDVSVASDPPYVLRNDGSADFDRVPLPTTSPRCRALRAVDLDGDGHRDLALGYQLVFPEILLGDGSGGFAPGGSMPMTALSTAAIEAVDSDRDGDLDLVLGNEVFVFVPADNQLFLNDGSAVFTDATSNLPQAVESTQDILAYDLSGDGILDLILGNSNNDTGALNRVYYGDGNGFYTDQPNALPADSDNTYDLEPGDVDGDGVADLVVGNATRGLFTFEAANRVYRGTGSGTFVDMPGGLPDVDDDTWALDLGDADGDGDLDAVVAAHEGQSRALYSQVTQLARSGTVRLGKPFALQLRAAPSSLGSVLYAAGTGSLPVPGIDGTFLLDPGSTVPLAALLLDPEGAGSVGVPALTSPALSGATIWTQALFTSPLSFSNPEPLLFTSL